MFNALFIVRKGHKGHISYYGSIVRKALFFSPSHTEMQWLSALQQSQLCYIFISCKVYYRCTECIFSSRCWLNEPILFLVIATSRLVVLFLSVRLVNMRNKHQLIAHHNRFLLEYTYMCDSCHVIDIQFLNSGYMITFRMDPGHHIRSSSSYYIN